MLLENQYVWIKIVDVTLLSIFESVSFLLIQTLVTVPAPIKAADTIRKLFFEEVGAATNQERLLFKK